MLEDIITLESSVTKINVLESAVVVCCQSLAWPFRTKYDSLESFHSLTYIVTSTLRLLPHDAVGRIQQERC